MGETSEAARARTRRTVTKRKHPDIGSNRLDELLHETLPVLAQVSHSFARHPQPGGSGVRRKAVEDKRHVVRQGVARWWLGERGPNDSASGRHAKLLKQLVPSTRDRALDVFGEGLAKTVVRKRSRGGTSSLESRRRRAEREK